MLLLMQDCNDWPVSFLGALYAGLVPVAVNTLLTADDYAYMLEHSRAQAVLVSGALLPALTAAMVKCDHEVGKVVVSRPQAPLLSRGPAGADSTTPPPRGCPLAPTGGALLCRDCSDALPRLAAGEAEILSVAVAAAPHREQLVELERVVALGDLLQALLVEQLARVLRLQLAEREGRVRRAGASRYLVEPNVKDGKGGLRDLHTLFWIAKYVYRVRETDELLERGVFDAQDEAYRDLVRAQLVTEQLENSMFPRLW